MGNGGESGPIISAVVAVGAHDRGIGSKNKLLWHIPDDLKRFRRLTLHHPVIMGRKTFESVLGYLEKPFPDRTNIVITRVADFSYPGVLVCHSLEEALDEAKKYDSEEVFIGGGGNVWAQALPYIKRLYLTLIDSKKKSDAFFPPYEHVFTKETFREKRVTSDGLHYVWINLERP